MLVALRLDDADEVPTLGDLAVALDEPARPIFLGRKGCLPATRLNLGLVQAEDALQALLRAEYLLDGVAQEFAAVYFNTGAAPVVEGMRIHHTSDERRFALDVHAGRQRVYERPARRAL